MSRLVAARAPAPPARSTRAVDSAADAPRGRTAAPGSAVAPVHIASGSGLGEGVDHLANGVAPSSTPPFDAVDAQPVPHALRADVERRTGHDLSRVRIYPQGSAAAAASRYRANAFAWGDQIAFAPGHWRPHTPGGQALLRHELAHVVQQRTSVVPATGTLDGLPVNRDVAFESMARSAALPGNDLAGGPAVAPSATRRAVPLAARAAHAPARRPVLQLQDGSHSAAEDTVEVHSDQEVAVTFHGTQFHREGEGMRLEVYWWSILIDRGEPHEALSSGERPPPIDDPGISAESFVRRLESTVGLSILPEARSELRAMGSIPVSPTGTYTFGRNIGAGELRNWFGADRWQMFLDGRVSRLPAESADVDRGDAGTDDSGAAATAPSDPTHTAAVDWTTAAVSFGETVAIGLAMVAVVGLAVGLEVITLGQATWLFVAIGASAGGMAYLNRREEIELRGYDVPVSATVVDAAGDVFGVSQLLEGVTGHQLGTDRVLSTEERSNQLGSGAGGVMLALTGSRAFRASAGVGSRALLARRGTVPPSTEGGAVALEELPSADAPAAPTPSQAPGPVESAARAALPENLRAGFDIWMEQIRSGGRRPGDPETILGRTPPDRIEAIARDRAAAYGERVRNADRARRMRSDPLDPDLPVRETRGSVRLRYETHPPTDAEIAQAQAIVDATGEPVELFGDTPGLRDYPGIDGIIGDQPRALSLKESLDPADVGYVRVHAVDAADAARANGYSHVEVHITMRNTLAEVQAAWSAAPAAPRGAGAIFDAAGTIARFVIRCTDGTWVIDPEVAMPVFVPGIVVPSSTSDSDRDGGSPDADPPSAGVP